MKALNKIKLKRIFTIGIVIILLIALLVYIWYLSAKKNALYKKDAFLFDTYISVSAYVRAYESKKQLDWIYEMLTNIDNDFSAAYNVKATAMDENESLSRCLISTSKLNEKYGDNINLTCGELTSLWGISTANPKVPTQNEIENAKKSIEDTLYHDGDFKAFDENTMLDFGAVAKGFALDEVFISLDYKLQDINDNYFIVSLGSSTLFYGTKPDGKKFKTAIRSPNANDEYLGYIETEAAFISTSGGYERFFEADGKKYEHILDTDTGYPVKTDLSSVTVIVPIESELSYGGGIKSDFLSTLIYMDGTMEIDKYLSDESFYVIAVDNNREIYLSENIPDGMFRIDTSWEQSNAK